MKWRKLAEAVERRRNELGLSKRQAISVAGMSANTWLKLENDAQPISEHLWRKVEIALDWEHGSVRSLLEGGDPTVSPTLPERVAQVAASNDELKEIVRELVRRMERLEARVTELE
ncbi:MAG: hypothetical protein AAF567_24280 [Actinomycetota bacterium]